MQSRIQWIFCDNDNVVYNGASHDARCEKLLEQLFPNPLSGKHTFSHQAVVRFPEIISGHERIETMFDISDEFVSRSRSSLQCTKNKYQFCVLVFFQQPEKILSRCIKMQYIRFFCILNFIYSSAPFFCHVWSH